MSTARHAKKRRSPKAALAAVFGGAVALAGVLLWSPSVPSHAVSRLAPAELSAPSLQTSLTVPEPAPAAQARSYRVRSGDTLWTIAQAQCHDGAKWRDLAQVNHLGNGNSLRTGQVITISCNG